jgi:hypothetical protein
MIYEHRWYRSPIMLPEGTKGKAQVRHRIVEPGESLAIIGMRQAILRGITPVSARIKERMVVHELAHEDHGVWMTDLPEELNQIAELLQTVEPTGRVLIGGLGLGILAHAVSERWNVSDVVVIEKDRDVIELCGRENHKTEIVESDIVEYLRTTNEQFDYYLLDTWQGTNEGTWWSQVMPLRRIIRQRFGKKPVVHCWAEDIMQGQIFRSLTTKPPHWYYSGLPVPMKEYTARQFLRNVGLPSWEKRYGAIVDENARREP